MNITFNEDSPAYQVCDACMAGPSLVNCHCQGSQTEGYPEPSPRNVEQIRLLLSRDAVLRDIYWGETGESQW